MPRSRRRSSVAIGGGIGHLIVRQKKKELRMRAPRLLSEENEEGI